MFPVRQSEGPFSASFRARLRDDRTRRLAGREHAKLTKAAFSPMAAYVLRFSDRIWLGRAVPMTATSWRSVVYSPLLDGETTLNAQVCTVSNSPCVSLLDATALPATLVELPQTGKMGGSSHPFPSVYREPGRKSWVSSATELRSLALYRFIRVVGRFGSSWSLVRAVTPYKGCAKSRWLPFVLSKRTARCPHRASCGPRSSGGSASALERLVRTD